jgi:sec-independent protein translocase protein TatA
MPIAAPELSILLFSPPGMPELLVILLIVVVLFGASRLPQLGKGLGEGIRNFRSGLKSAEKEAEEALQAGDENEG